MAADFPRFLTIEEAAERLGVSVARVSMWIGECKLPVAARSEYAGFLLRTLTVETVGCYLAGAVPPEARFESVVDAPRAARSPQGQSACAAFARPIVEPNHPRVVLHMT
jgi:hypothetical protein